jgi:DNA-binding CsgD family transcriptional regulator
MCLTASLSGAIVSIRRSAYLRVKVRLNRCDLEEALGFLREAGEFDGPEPFPPELLSSLTTLVRCEDATYAEFDRVHRKMTLCAASSIYGSHAAGAGAPEEVYWATVHEHPVRQHRLRTGQLGAFKIYDFTSPRQMRRTQFYADFLRPWGPNGFLMSVCLPAPPGRTRTFTFHRERADFGERERTLLDLLQPHLFHLRRAAEVRMRARATILATRDDRLTERETEILRRVAEGMRNREIAQALWIAPGTVKKHLDNIYAKLDVRDRTAAVTRLHQRERS